MTQKRIQPLRCHETYLLDVLLVDEAGGRADLMDDAPLQTAIHSLDGLHHAE